MNLDINKQTEKEPFVLETLRTVYELVQSLEKMFGHDDEYSRTTGKSLLADIKSSIEIIEHDAVQIPRSVSEAQMMNLLSRNYLNEVDDGIFKND